MSGRGDDGRGIERAAEASAFASAFYGCFNQLGSVGRTCITALLQLAPWNWFVGRYIERLVDAAATDEGHWSMPAELAAAVRRHHNLTDSEIESAMRKAVLEFGSSLGKLHFEEFLNDLTSSKRMRDFRPWEEQLEPLIYCEKHGSWAAREDYASYNFRLCAICKCPSPDMTYCSNACKQAAYGARLRKSKKR